MASLLDGELFLWPKTQPGLLHNARAQRRSAGASVILTAGIDDDDLVAEGQCAQTGLDARGLIEGDDDGAERLLHSRSCKADCTCATLRAAIHGAVLACG